VDLGATRVRAQRQRQELSTFRGIAERRKGIEEILEQDRGWQRDGRGLRGG
jgi:hypothetical protein